MEVEQTVQPAISDLDSLPETQRWRAQFFSHWRLWPKNAAERDYRLGLLPADTRIPDHTIWNHMQIVSALAGCQGGDGRALKPAFLKLQLGPVQDFIAQARSTRDLWSGSYLISWLMATGMKALSAEIGPDAVVFPNLRGQPVFDLQWRDDLWEKVHIGDVPVWDSLHHDHRDLLTPNLPNVFLAVVPAARAAELGELVERAIHEVWKDIADKVWAYCDGALLESEGINLTADEGSIVERNAKSVSGRKASGF
jgi:CRISPR-associated protein Cmr2